MDLREKLRLFLAEYGERGYVVLRAVLDEARSNRLKLRLGDVSARGVRERLRMNGVEYNPVPLLVKLEREVGLLETTYKSSTQHWWKIVDTSVLEEALREYAGGEAEPSLPQVEEPPEARVFRMQLEIVGLREIARKVSLMASKSRLTSSDWVALKKIVLEELPVLVRIKREIENATLSDAFQEELELIDTVLATVEALVSREKKRGAQRQQETLTYIRGLADEEP